MGRSIIGIPLSWRGQKTWSPCVPGWQSGKVAFRALALVALGLAIAAMAADRARAGDPEVGYRLAREWCSGCHFVEGGRAASDAAPAFAEIANRPNATPEGWRVWLADPHPPMPNLSLSREEADAIIAFLQSLRDQ